MAKIFRRQIMDNSPFESIVQSHMKPSKTMNRMMTLFWVLFFVVFVSAVSFFGLFAYAAYTIAKDSNVSANKAGQVIKEFNKGMNEGN